MSWHLLLLLVLPMTRGCLSPPSQVSVERGADVVIGAVLPVHRPGGGVFGCGSPNREGVEAFEAMRWAVHVLNKKSGLISEGGGGSLIPGVKIGLQAYDTCGHEALAVEHITELFPVLRSGQKSCDNIAENSSMTIGVVDMSDLSHHPEVSESFRDYLIPSIELSFTTVIPPEKMAQVLHGATKDLQWSNVVVLHEDEEYSISAAKQLTRISAGSATCINTIYSLPKIVAGVKSNRQDLRAFRKMFRTVTSGMEDGSAVVVITKTAETATRFLQVMAEFPDLVSKVQWLFSWIPPSSSVGGLGPRLSMTRLFSIAPFPDRVQHFEEYWSDLRQMSSFSNDEDRWFLESFMSQKGCKVPGPVDSRYSSLPPCGDRVLTESPVDVLLRTSRVIPALTSIFTLATALHKAWESKCEGRPGLCPELRATPRKEFVNEYLEPIEYLVGAEAGREVERRVPRSAEGGMLKGSKLSLTRYFHEEGIGVTFKQVVVYESEGSRVLDPDFEPVPSRCSSTKCKNCVRPRQSRLDDRLQDLDYSESLSFPQADIVLPILVPLHYPGLSPLECGAALDPAAVQQLEAALWTVGRVNDDPASLAGARIGLAVVDTCSSPLLATQRLATFVARAHMEPGAAMAIVSVASPEETLAATTVLRPLNISVVSTSDLLPFLGPEDHLGLNNHLFQVSSPVETQVLAAMDVFDLNGWRFVSVIYEDTPLSTVGHHSFMKVTKQRGVCVGQQFEIQHQDTSPSQVDKFMESIAEAKSQGSSVIVLLTSEEGTRKVLNSLGKLWEAGVVDPGDLVLVGLGEWGEKLEVFRGLEKEALGSIVFKQETGEVSEFSSHYQRLLPGGSPHNPWFDELWQQASGNDPPVEYRSSQTTTNTVQAIVAVAAGIASMRNELCQVDQGLCSSMTQHSGLPHLLSQHISSVKSPRLDHPGQFFRFTGGGFGDTPIEIYNYRKINGKDTNYLKVGSHDGHYNRLADIITYTPKGEVPVDSIPSTCTSDCYKCRSSAPHHFLVPSPQDLYIGVALGVHEPTANPLSCGPLRPGWGFQNHEALLWALDTINSDDSILPGVQLGMVAFDTCASKEKAAMDLSNFFSGSLRESLPAPESVVGFLVDGTRDVVQPLVDLTMPMGMTTVASSVMAPEFGDVRKYSHLLKMNLPSNVVVSSFVSVLRYFHWKYVSVVYTDGSDDPLFGEEGFNELKNQMDTHGIDIAVTEKVGLQEKDLASTMDIIAHRLKIKQNAGARAVILLLPPSLLNHLLSAVKRLQHVGRSRVGDFVWLAFESLEPFQMFPDQSLGALVLRQRSGDIPAFKKHFTHLHVNSYRRNPWFREYWEQMFNCRGNTCGPHQSLAEVGFSMDRSVPPTVNALFSLAFSLDSAHRQVCTQTPGKKCDRQRLREKLFEAVRKVRFTGLDGTPVVFGDKNYIKGTLEVFNFREVGDVRAFIEVGEVDEAHGLSINTSMSRGYDEHGEEVSLDFVPSLCNDSESCPRRGSEGGASFMKIPPNQEFIIGVLLPVHQPGDNYFVCSRVVDESAFQSLLALSFALEKVNENMTVLPQIKLGALVFDHCGRRQRAEEQIFSFIASDGSLPFSEAHLRSRAMVAALTPDHALAEDLSPLFESALIPQIATPSALTTPSAEMQRRKRNSEEDPEKREEIVAIVDLLDSMNWRFVSVVHSGSNLFWDFLSLAKERKICISESLRPDDIATELKGGEAKVVVLLLEDPGVVKRALEVAREVQVLEELVWITMEAEGGNVAKVLQGDDVDFFVVRPETHDVPGFREYYSRFSLSDHAPLPDAWFEEFWQHRFGCHLPHSALRHLHPTPCGGDERLSPAPPLSPAVHHTVTAVEAVAGALHDYLRRYCAHGDAAASIEDCGQDARRLLWRETRRRMAAVPTAECPDGDCGPIRMPLGLQVFQLRKAKMHPVYQQVGLWKDEKLSLKTEEMSFIGGETVTSACRLECQKCMEQLSVDPEELNLLRPGLYTNFGTLWGMIVSALSLLGVVMVLLCASYFLVSFQVTVGTTVLGYMVLFGLLLLYAVNFAFVLAPSEGTCGVRRFGLGLAYAIVFAGMLVKVMNIWRTMGYHQHLGDTYHLTSPAALLVVAVGLVIIQVILSSAWLILIPPTTGVHAGEWRCHPATTFEDELVISLVYVMLMLAITILFSVLTWCSKDNNNESRWILTCCLLMSVVWVAWTVVSTQVLHRYRDLTISAANLACASVVMLCMYLRKVYLYHRLSRQEEKKARLKQSVPLPAVPNMYGTVSRPRPFVGPPVTTSQESLAPSRMALISESEGSDSGSGSTQVQGADLYPLDMYDGGSQFQPPSLHMGGDSSLNLHEPPLGGGDT